MNATTNNAPKQRKPRAKPPRSVRVLEQPGPETDGWAAIAITVGKQMDTYLLRTIPTQLEGGLLAFEVEKLDVNFETAAVYHVHLSDKPEDCTCDCQGHERHGHCKHREGIETLVKRRKLPAYRSAGDMARNDPEAYRRHNADTDAIFTLNPKHRYQGPDEAA